MVSVTFELSLRGGRWLDESELADPSALAGALVDGSDPSGAVVLASGGQRVRIEDALAPLALRLCSDAVEQLLRGETAIVEHFEYAGSVRLRPAGDEVLVTGDFIDSLSVDRAGLLDGLVACGERIVDLFRNAGAAYVDHAEFVAPRVTGARRALTAAMRGGPQTHEPPPEPS